ncbi:hypothetical protein EVU97_12330 [Dermacoccus sp. 147Ba]|uniref:DUF4064 domain-containing protein n=1 Tax=Dermacoccus sp. 147Ba TaxID=2510111 RepID=UPI00101D9F52|nr:DUF4064 domain-containing protein [Dermacoccus sp. 147Ba]RYI21176.1 hypothetical protein EVU97_12330 [Dermacoccus sp. 147Ba]
MSDNNEKPASTWGGGDSEAETRIAGGSTPAAEPNPVHDHTQRFENDATQVAYRDQPQAAAQPGQSPARTESPTQASSAHSQAYPSAPIAQQQSAPYAQGYPGAAGQQGQYGAGQQYGSAPQGGQYNSAPQGQYGAGQQYNSSPQGGQQYGSAPQGGHAQPGQYNSSPQGGQQYGSAPQGGHAQPGQYNSSPQGGQQYNSAPQGGYAQPGQYSSSPQGGQTYGSGQHTTPAHGGQQGQYTSAAYGQSQSAQPTKTSSASPVAKFGPFLPALLALIAPFVAWVTFKSGSETVALNGIGGNSNSANPTLGESSNTGGIFVLILAIGLAVAGVLAALGKLNAKVTGIVTAALGVVLLIIGILQFPSTASAVGDGGAASGYSATIGAGVWLTLLAGLAALAVGVVAFLQSRKGSSASATNGGQQWNGGYQQGQQQFGQGNGQQYGSAPQGGFGQNH